MNGTNWRGVSIIRQAVEAELDAFVENHTSERFPTNHEAKHTKAAGLSVMEFLRFRGSIPEFPSPAVLRQSPRFPSSP